jgi:hypothetical protein
MSRPKGALECASKLAPWDPKVHTQKGGSKLRHSSAPFGHAIYFARETAPGFLLTTLLPKLPYRERFQTKYRTGFQSKMKG